MQNIKFVKEIDYKSSFRTEQVCGIYDLNPTQKLKKEFSFDLDLENQDWQIGLIVGTSGAGKSSLAKELFKDNYDVKYKWSDNSSFLNDFSKNININIITTCLSNVGFSSPPKWLLPFNQLSTGQQFRVNVVRAILESKELCCIDEFTSVVDREVAKIGSHCVQKFVRKSNKKFVAVSCHNDIINWLKPDWVFNVNTNEFSRGLLQRPKIDFKIYKSDIKIWKLFKEYHYLDTSIHVGAQCFVGYVWDKPVAFGSYIHFPHSRIKKAKREHRTVVLPDYQGLGLGNRLSDFVAEYCVKNNNRYFSTTSQPTMIQYRNKSKNWAITRKLSHVGGFGKNSTMRKNSHSTDSSSSKRMTYSFEYLIK